MLRRRLWKHRELVEELLLDVVTTLPGIRECGFCMDPEEGEQVVRLRKWFADGRMDYQYVCLSCIAAVMGPLEVGRAHIVDGGIAVVTDHDDWVY